MAKKATKRKTAAQIAASKRNLEKARKASKKSVRNANWKSFAKAARKEMGSKFTGNVTGDMLFGGKLSAGTVKKYKKYLRSI